MSTTVYLIVSLLLAGFSFFVLYTGKFPIIRMPAWVFFYLSMIIVSMIWVSFFFPEVSLKGELLGVHEAFSFWGNVCSVCFVFGGFFLWVYLRYKNAKFFIGKYAKNVAGIFTILIVISIIVISFVSLSVR